MIAKIRLVFWIGIVMLFFPFFGITDWLRAGLGIVIGVVLMYTAFSLRYKYKKMKFKLRQEFQEPTESDTVTTHG